MTTGELALVVAALTAAGVLLNALIAQRRAPTDIKKGEAEARKLNEEADQVQVGTSLALVTALKGQLSDVRAELVDMRLQFTDVRTQLTDVRGQLTSANLRVSESRIDIVRMGTQMDCERDSFAQERKESTEWKNKLALILGKLLSQLKAAGFQPELESDDLAMLDKLVKIG